MTTTAEADRAAILDRVAEGIWKGAKAADPMPWHDFVSLAESTGDHHALEMIEFTRQGARNAVEALIISTGMRPGSKRMAHAGEHLSGLEPLLCAEIFDAMLTEVLA